MVKDPDLSLLWIGSLLWCQFNPWPGNLYMPQVPPKKKKKEESTYNFIDWLCVCVCVCLGPYPQQMEFPRLEVKSELQPLAYTTVTATPDLSSVFNLHHSSPQYQILNSLSEARDPTRVLMDTSQIHLHWATMGTPNFVDLILVSLYLSLKTLVSIYMLFTPVAYRSSLAMDQIWAAAAAATYTLTHCTTVGSL